MSDLAPVLFGWCMPPSFREDDDRCQAHDKCPGTIMEWSKKPRRCSCPKHDEDGRASVEPEERDAKAGEAFFEWLADPYRQALPGGCGAFARWVVAAVEEGELLAKDVWYPKAMEAKASQFPRGDWDDAKGMYITREMRYCSGDGREDEAPMIELEDGTWATSARSCWVGGSCSGCCSAPSD